MASGRPSAGPVFPAHDGEHWQPDDWRNWRRRTWQKIAPPGTRPRDLRGSYVTLRVYEGMPLTEIARHVGTSIAMLDRHYAGVIANWDGERVSAGEQIRRARAAIDSLRGGRALTCVGRNLVYVWCTSGRRPQPVRDSVGQGNPCKS